MKAFIEEMAWASCTFDLAGSPQQLIKESDRKVVGYAPEDRLLTIDDRATKEKFLCKAAAKKWGGFLALLGGIAIGGALVLSGPVGWIALGAVVVVAAGTTIAVCVHECTDPLKNGKWGNFHATVLIRGKNAVLYNKSQLLCEIGGIVVASETEEAAQALSDAMKWNARLEVGVQILQNGIVGFIAGYSGKEDPLAPIFAIEAYNYAEIEHELSAEESLAVALGLTEVDFATYVWTKGKLGAEFNLKGGLLALASLTVGYVGDKYEETLKEKNDEIANEAAERESEGSGKTIVCIEY